MYVAHELQAVDVDSLTTMEGVEWEEVSDHGGFPCVDIRSNDRAKLVEYIRDNWGDDDREWFNDTVARIAEYPAPLGVRVKRDAPMLVVTYDLTGLTPSEIAALSGEAQAQAERNKGDGFGGGGHPSVDCEAILLNTGREIQPDHTVLVRLHVEVAGDVDEHAIEREIMGALEVGTDADRTPTLYGSEVTVEEVETLD